MYTLDDNFRSMKYNYHKDHIEMGEKNDNMLSSDFIKIKNCISIM